MTSQVAPKDLNAVAAEARSESALALGKKLVRFRLGRPIRVQAHVGDVARAMAGLAKERGMVAHARRQWGGARVLRLSEPRGWPGRGVSVLLQPRGRGATELRLAGHHWWLMRRLLWVPYVASVFLTGALSASTLAAAVLLVAAAVSSHGRAVRCATDWVGDLGRWVDDARHRVRLAPARVVDEELALLLADQDVRVDAPASSVRRMVERVADSRGVEVTFSADPVGKGYVIAFGPGEGYWGQSGAEAHVLPRGSETATVSLGRRENGPWWWQLRRPAFALALLPAALLVPIFAKYLVFWSLVFLAVNAAFLSWVIYDGWPRTVRPPMLDLAAQVLAEAMERARRLDDGPGQLSLSEPTQDGDLALAPDVDEGHADDPAWTEHSARGRKRRPSMARPDEPARVDDEVVRSLRGRRGLRVPLPRAHVLELVKATAGRRALRVRMDGIPIREGWCLRFRRTGLLGRLGPCVNAVAAPDGPGAVAIHVHRRSRLGWLGWLVTWGLCVPPLAVVAAFMGAAALPLLSAMSALCVASALLQWDQQSLVREVIDALAEAVAHARRVEAKPGNISIAPVSGGELSAPET